MSDFIERFKPLIDSDWPAPIDEMAKHICATDERGHLELRLGRLLSQLASDQLIDEEVRSALIPDAIAFELFETSGSAWEGAYFGPWISGPDNKGRSFERPGRTRITGDVIDVWRQRREFAMHPLAKARYGDAAWDLAQIAGCNRDPEDARVAIDAYAAESGWPDDGRDHAKRLGRALSLALSISDAERVRQVRERIVSAALRRHEGAGRPWYLLLAIDELVVKRGHDLVEAEDLITLMEDHFARRIEQGNAFDAKDFGDRLLALFNRRAAYEDVKRVAGQIAACFEAQAGKGAALVAMSHLKTAFKLYRDAGLENDAERVRKAIASATSRSADEMALISHETTIEVADLDKYADELTRGNKNEARRRFFLGQLVTRAEVGKSLDECTKDAVTTRIMAREIVTVQGNTVNLPPLDQARDLHLVYHASQSMQFMWMFLHYAADRFVTRHELSPDALAEFGERCGLFPTNRHGVRRRAFEAYLLGDHATFIHLIIPQIEHGLRLLLREVGKSTNVTRDDSTWRQLTLHQVLKQSELAEILGEDMCFYLSVLLTEDLGWNIRDVVCHGLVEDRWFSKPIADRLLHVVVGLTLFDLAPPEADEISDTTK